MKKKKQMLLLISLSFVLIAIGAFLFPVFRYTIHSVARKGVFDTECTKFPIHFNQDGYFQVKALINNMHKVELNIDTKAASLMREDSIARYGGKYWGSLPFKSTNAYQQKFKISFYSFQSIKISDVEVKTPLFKSISKDNLIYDILGEGVLGNNLLSIGCWKFDLIAGIAVEDCQLVNIRTVNSNYIGAAFMKNFNFMLIYGHEDEDGCKHLFLNKRKAHTSEYSIKYVSKFGFGINRQHGKAVVELIVPNGLAEKAGLALGDEIVALNGEEQSFFSSSNIGNLFMQYADALDELEIKTKEKGVLVLTDLGAVL